MLRQIVVAVFMALLLAACGKSSSDAAGADKAAQRPLLIAPEDLLTLKLEALGSGPAITGTIQPERRADLRAEVASVVLQVLKDNGDAVKRGELLMRLDDTSIRDSLASAEQAVRASTQTLQQAEHQLERLKTLQSQGMISMQALEDSELRRNSAQSDLVAAKARAAQAVQQLQRTEVRAPFDGLVSERKASVGDTAQIGKELVKVIDPASMRFEGLVSADAINQLKAGQQVSFRVNGAEQIEYRGRIKRVDPAANPTTRQVAVLVDFADANQPRVSGLYAEGRVETASTQSLMAAEASLVRAGDSAYVWRIKGDRLQKVRVTLGERDARRGDYPVKSGLTEGDRILRNPGSALKDGETVELSAPSGAASAASGSGK